MDGGRPKPDQELTDIGWQLESGYRFVPFFI